ncbi:hypothetical protein BCR33DRAFT_845047 [Rhizoclosmatium globosum]|uniref:Uncharacterized protein n=1 Tax=Rhizoclosmatium globosum TaxID=329046 RepID=A0A1Y2D3T9_9FUNG|nr:hypothetical protein BCR33DRAFT_845047 [Rhizoclosmatium globosum]|eukprot:ORY53814.1 hypothetical protein BCR33DRAFT_845047 [Rhizoclosmatium globosum]
MVYPTNMVGGPLERFVTASPDCGGSVPDPTPAMLKCLEFSLPATFTLDVDFQYASFEETNLNGTLASLFNFTSTDPANFLSRLTAVYGLDVSAQGYKLGVNFNNNLEPPTAPHTVMRAASWFKLIPKANNQGPAPLCYLQWSALSMQYPEQYILAYNNPVCGPSAPKLLDTSETSKFKLAVAGWASDGTVYPTNQMFGAAYGLSPANTVYKFVTNFKFSFTVTSNHTSPTDENSCVYTYLVTNRQVLVRNLTLVSYNLGALTVKPGLNVNDGCLDNLQILTLSDYAFANRSAACVNVLDEATRIFNVSTGSIDTNLRRRDAGDAMFRFVDTSLVVKTTTTSTSTFTSTSISTFTATSISTIAATSISTIAATPAATINSASAKTATTAAVPSVVASGVASGSVIPTSSVAPVPTGYAAPSAYGAPGSNNIYKGSAVKTCGAAALIVLAFIVSKLKFPSRNL